MRLVKKLVVLHQGTKDEKKFYSFAIRLENGSELKIQPNSYKDNKGNMQSNYRELVLIADDELPLDK